MPIHNHCSALDARRNLTGRSCRRVLSLWLLIALGGSGIGCLSPGKPNAPAQSVAAAQRPLRPTHWVRTELYFGAVAADLWSKFLSESVTPLFPDGLTIFEASGQWRAKDGNIHAIPTRVLVILHSGDAESDSKLERIRAAYKNQFQHESVLRVDGPALVSF